MKASRIITLFLPPMDCVKTLILSETVIEKYSTKQDLSSSKSCKVAGFQPLITAAMAFTYRKNDGYFNFNAISFYKVYIDF